MLGLVEHGLALALHPISRCRQHHACAQHQVCQPAAGAGLDQLGILHRREYHLRPTQKYIDYSNIRSSYLSTVVQRVNKRFPKEDVKKLEQMLTIISNELMPELNLENNPEAPEEKKTAR